MRFEKNVRIPIEKGRNEISTKFLQPRRNSIQNWIIVAIEKNGKSTSPNIAHFIKPY
jgi:hypothetical protein